MTRTTRLFLFVALVVCTVPILALGLGKFHSDSTSQESTIPEVECTVRHSGVTHT
jgi:hypothetical protein